MQYVARGPEENLEKAIILTPVYQNYTKVRLLGFMRPPESIPKGFSLWAVTTFPGPETVNGKQPGGGKLLQGTVDTAYSFQIYQAPTREMDRGLQMRAIPIPIEDKAPIKVVKETELLIFKQPVRGGGLASNRSSR